MHLVARRTQSHIGEVLGISASRVSQLAREAIGALRTTLQRDGWTPARQVPSEGRCYSMPYTAT